MKRSLDRITGVWDRGIMKTIKRIFVALVLFLLGYAVVKVSPVQGQPPQSADQVIPIEKVPVVETVEYQRDWQRVWSKLVKLVERVYPENRDVFVVDE